MTRDEKFNAIIERLKAEGHDFEPLHISAMVIAGYLGSLAEKKLIESAYTVTSTGKLVVAICEEFDWKPSDEEIREFVCGMVEPAERPAFMYLLKKYRDDRETLLEEFARFQKSESDSETAS